MSFKEFMLAEQRAEQADSFNVAKEQKPGLRGIFRRIMDFLSGKGYIESPQSFNNVIRNFLKIGNYKTGLMDDYDHIEKQLEEGVLSDFINKIATAMADDMDKEMKRSARKYDADKFKRKKLIVALRKHFSNSEIEKIYKMLMGSKPGSASRKAVVKKVAKELNEAAIWNKLDND